MAPVPAYFYPLAVYFIICIIVGCTGNLVMIIVTIRSKQLRYSCNIIIAAACCAAFLNLLGQIPYIIYVATGDLVPHHRCCLMELPALIGVYQNPPLMLCLALDRLFAISLPQSYQRMQSELWSFCLYLLPFFTFSLGIAGTGLAMTFVGSFGDNTFRNEQVACAIPVAFKGAYTLQSVSLTSCIAASCAIYALVFIILRRRGASDSFKATFKSIGVTVLLLAFAWLQTAMFQNLQNFVPALQGNVILINYAEVAIIAAISSNCYVYYHYSKVYRNEIRDLFCKKKSVSVVVTQMTSVQRSRKITNSN